jgi:hypothetical protein
MTERDAREDLAFLRSIVAGGEDSMCMFGLVYFAAGLCYGIQILLNGMRILGWVPGGSAIDLAIGILPTIAFLLILLLLIVRDRGRSRLESSTSRAIGLAFACVGIANLALVAAIGIVAWRWQSMATWLIYPCVVVILQGMAWMFAWALRRRAWLGTIAAGWFATGIGMAAALAAGSTGWYLAVLGIGLFAFMTAPGLHLMRSGRSSA